VKLPSRFGLLQQLLLGFAGAGTAGLDAAVRGKPDAGAIDRAPGGYARATCTAPGAAAWLAGTGSATCATWNWSSGIWRMYLRCNRRSPACVPRSPSWIAKSAPFRWCWASSRRTRRSGSQAIGANIDRASISRHVWRAGYGFGRRAWHHRQRFAHFLPVDSGACLTEVAEQTESAADRGLPEGHPGAADATPGIPLAGVARRHGDICRAGLFGADRGTSRRHPA
jgi:hypothetical protein